MKTISELKLDGLWGKYALTALVYFLVYLLLAAILVVVSGQINDGTLDQDSPTYNLLQIVFEILVIPLGWSYYMIFLRNMRGMHDTAKTSNLFDG